MDVRVGIKGQSSIEYLMTYGWALLIIGVVMVVLWQMGAFNPAVTPPGCTGFSQIRPADWKAVKSTNNMSITLNNDAGTKVRLDQVNVTMYGTSCLTEALNKEMRAGETYLAGVNGADGNGCPASWIPEAGQYYRADIVIVYRNIASEIDHRSVGECHGTVEP